MSNVTISTKVYEGPLSEVRLSALALDLPRLQRVVLAGEYARAEATANDPINAGPLDAYRYRVRTFRDLFGVDGWSVDRAGGLEMTRSPCGPRVVVTRAGDEATGLKIAFPQPKRSVGSGTKGVVNDGMFLNPDWMNVAPPGDPEHETWMLLVHREGDVVRAELSQPTGISECGDVLGWHERIILPEIDLTDPDGKREPSGEVADEIDVPVTRKR